MKLHLLNIALIMMLASCSGGSFSNVKTVTIGNQTWAAQNAAVTTYNDGTAIPEVKDNAEWRKCFDSGIGCWCYYNNDPANGTKYGIMYNMYALCINRKGSHGGIAPSGFHVATDKDYETLIKFVDKPNEDPGKHLKDTESWGKASGDNTSGWCGLGGGDREFDGEFLHLKEYSDWWAVEPVTGSFRCFELIYSNKNELSLGSSAGRYVRFVKD